MCYKLVYTCFDNNLLEQTKELAALLKEYWSVEIFWFPFNSLLSWLIKMLPTPSAQQLSIPELPVPQADPITAVRTPCIIMCYAKLP